MNDLLLRQKINLLTGLTEFDQLTSSGIALTTGTWVAINPNPTVILTSQLTINAYKITLSGSYATPKFRIVAGTSLGTLNKIFPYASDMDLLSGVDQYLQHSVQIPPNYYVQMQVKVTGTGCTANLDYASIISVPTYSYT